MKKKADENLSDDGTKIYRPLGKRFSVGEHLADIPFGTGDDLPKTLTDDNSLRHI